MIRERTPILLGAVKYWPVMDPIATPLKLVDCISVFLRILSPQGGYGKAESPQCENRGGTAEHHHHSHGPANGFGRPIAVTVILIAAKALGAWRGHSLALGADAAHSLGDCV
jgi:hypothetical protein